MAFLVQLGPFTQHNIFKFHAIACITFHSFFMTEYYCTVWTYCLLFFHSSGDRYLGRLHFWLLWIMTSKEHWCTSICLNLFSVILGICPGVKLLMVSYGDYMCNFLRNAELFSTAVAPLNILTSNIWGLKFFCCSQQLLFSVFFWIFLLLLPP